MTTPDAWRKSSYSGSGDGNACVEIANLPTRVAIRDSKTPTHATLSRSLIPISEPTTPLSNSY
ncbi:DUF397 domain-containing protein, partial [Streptomyces sp. S3(2020)]|uniref:DUF397 domain-containing protein n=1 Tax=Streptomyces sp. S3(2020) TaxID=2732044 RepID=UPI0014881C77